MEIRLEIDRDELEAEITSRAEDVLERVLDDANIDPTDYVDSSEVRQMLEEELEEMDLETTIREETETYLMKHSENHHSIRDELEKWESRFQRLEDRYIQQGHELEKLKQRKSWWRFWK